MGSVSMGDKNVEESLRMLDPVLEIVSPKFEHFLFLKLSHDVQSQIVVVDRLIGLQRSIAERVSKRYGIQRNSIGKLHFKKKKLSHVLNKRMRV